jgi:hypothetical protein
MGEILWTSVLKELQRNVLIEPVLVDLGTYINLHGTSNQTSPNLVETHTKIGPDSSGFKGEKNISKG